MERLRRKIDGARDLLPTPVKREEKEKNLGLIYYAAMENTLVEIEDMLEETGLSVSTCRVRALPYHSGVQSFI